VNVNRLKLFGHSAQLDEAAFEALFYEHYPRLHAVLFRLVGDPDEADDLATETLWRLWENPPRTGENLAGWLYRVATRLGYNAMRSARRRAQYEMEAAIPETGEDPSRVAEQRETRRQVRQVLRQLPLRDVQILVLRHSGFSYQEIAAAVGVTPSSVGTLLNRAEARFEKIYRQGENHAPER
jgi:RNA polymerase sigma factor (sigma-70 family)